MIRTVLAPIALLGLLPAPLSAAETPPSTTVSSEIPPGFSVAPDGTTLIHTASGLRFPAEFKGFTRLKERAFDLGGDYIAIGYDHPLGTGTDRLVARIAVVHIPDMTARDHYLMMRQAAMAHFSAPEILSEGPATSRTNRRLDAYRGTFIGYHDNEPWLFSLTTANYGYWGGRITAAYPQSQAEEAQKYLDVLLAQIRAQKPRAPKD